MREKGYLKAVPIRNILQIGLAQYDQWVEEGLDPNQPLAKMEVAPEIADLFEGKWPYNAQHPPQHIQQDS